MMPYIRKDRRGPLDRDIASLVQRLEQGEYATGDLNYVITRLVDGFLADQQNYAAYNEVIGVLECAKLELYRRRVAPYESNKAYDNGDVYTLPDFKG